MMRRMENKMTKRILIIEDEQAIAELERDYLEIEQFQVDLADNGRSGLEKVQQGIYDLVILDLMLPEINGFDLCKKIREQYNIPVLMVSAKKEDIDKIRGLGLGADDYITKPFSPSVLVARVKAHLARYERLTKKEEPMKQDLHIRNLRIQSASRRVYLDQELISLTSTEYDLLYFLATNPDTVFSKDVLLDRIWGMDHYGDTATVTVHIGKIREKIEKNTNKKGFIETVWGVGYRFNL